jgi:hypothetical protein
LVNAANVVVNRAAADTGLALPTAGGDLAVGVIAFEGQWLGAEFESDLIRMCTREGMAVAKAKGKLKGKQPKLSPMQNRELRRMYDTGDHPSSDLSDVFRVSRPTIYRTLARQRSAG